MRGRITRRGFGAVVGASTLAPALASADPQPPLRLTAETRVLEVKGKAARVFGLRGPGGRDGLALAPGERFRVDLANRAGASTIIHWHGQPAPWRQDGFPWPQTPPIPSGTARSFDFRPEVGTYWMHSHQGLQEQALMAAPLIVHSAAEMREDRQEIVLMLHDFSFRSPDALLAGLLHMPQAQMHEAVRMTENVPPPAHPPKVPPTGPASGGMAGMAMDLNDIRYDAFLANDRTLDDPAVVSVERSGRVRLRVINGAASSQFWIDLGGLTGHVVAADGRGVHPIAGRYFPLAIAQRLDILVDLPREGGAFPIFATLEGTNNRTGLVMATPGAVVARLSDHGPAKTLALDNAFERRLASTRPLEPRPADLVHPIVLGGSMTPYRWSLDGQYWPSVTPLMLEKGQRVEIDLVNRSMMPHPMHLHGHSFQVVALDGRRIDGAVRDTVLVPGRMGARVRIAFDADNPGRWAFHCHNLYHMAAGMMTEFRYRGIDV